MAKKQTKLPKTSFYTRYSATAFIAVIVFGLVGGGYVFSSYAARPVKTKPPLTVAPIVAPSTLASTATVKTTTISKNGASLNFEYCSNGDLNGVDSTVTTVVFVVHGDTRNACDHANYIIEAATKSAKNTTTLVVAPHFYTTADSVPSSMLYWSDGGWKSGANSLDTPASRPWRTGSYDVMDNLLAKANKTQFSSLNRVVVVGHSAGGQFTNRYAASTRNPGDISNGIARKYVVANPSSYLYFNSQRYVGSTLRGLTSSEISACTGYDQYKYGMVNRYAYLSSLSDSAIKNQYLNSKVTYLLGDADIVADSELDVSCEAKLQGAQRYDRGNKYYQYLGQVLGQTVYSNQTKSVVPGVGHQARAMYTSTQGQSAIFN